MLSNRNDIYAFRYDRDQLQQASNPQEKMLVLDFVGSALFDRAERIIDHDLLEELALDLPYVSEMRTYNARMDRDRDSCLSLLASGDCFITLGDGQSVFIIRDQKSPHSKGYACLPGGVTDINPLTTALKELNEEIILLRRAPHAADTLEIALVALDNDTGGISVQDKEELTRTILENAGPNTLAALANIGVTPADIKHLSIMKTPARVDPRFAEYVWSVCYLTPLEEFILPPVLVPIGHLTDNSLVLTLPIVVDGLKTADGWTVVDSEKYDREVVISTPAALKESRNPPASKPTAFFARIADGTELNMPVDPALEIKGEGQIKRRASAEKIYKELGLLTF